MPQAGVGSRVQEAVKVLCEPGVCCRPSRPGCMGRDGREDAQAPSPRVLRVVRPSDHLVGCHARGQVKRVASGLFFSPFVR